MTTTTKSVTVHDRSSVAPLAAAEAAAEFRLPLTYFDMFWVYFHPIERLLFYPYPCSISNFLENIIPNLKISLSKALTHYLPLSGNLLISQNPDKPELRYCPGDSVLVTFAESPIGDFDFDYLTGNQARDSGFDKIPLLAVQITLFPETGISIGITNHHVAGDASSIVGFIKAWCSFAKLGENGKIPVNPVYDRSLIRDPSGRADIFWNQIRASKLGASVAKLPTNRFRATFILRKNEIEMLKNLALAKNPGLVHLSSFTVTTAYVWACMAKSAGPAGENIDENEPEYFGFAVDGRQRLDPPLPAAYFGNCLPFVVAEIEHGFLRGEDGFSTAAKSIGDLIANKVNNKDELMREADEWLVKYGPLFRKRYVGVAGSPKFDLYDADFGWGKPSKYEAVSIDRESSISLCRSRECEGGLEIGLSLVREKMDAFAAIFHDGLKM
ncbi:malonyl-coenzyme:anthocyanin 5-o-glucoside-6'''-o-malonyltransferase [Phtheirospermum japonicum]|uniref:Malonyl-coenzyme:anthocyanin 5-o-glucoside-6'''-o-malonyltransferase n=1 Tax=Phtheirospermum japonicum TaxID=374723 RepID=A0A830B5R4_9LAMI|nr:malonyl-coenzyme:anthocyanin 5-o-glucoside-6'''-o-malonyltransferase [Phtheirospermum japonicum]